MPLEPQLAVARSLFQRDTSTAALAGRRHLECLDAARAAIHGVDYFREYSELQALSLKGFKHLDHSDRKLYLAQAARLANFERSEGILYDALFSAVALSYAVLGLDRPAIVRALRVEPWFIQHEILSRWGWIQEHQTLLGKGAALPHPFSCEVADRGQAGRRTDREFYQLIQFGHGLRAHDGEELLFLEKRERPDFILEDALRRPVGAEMTEAAVSFAWSAERDAEDKVLAAVRSVLAGRGTHVRVVEPASWRQVAQHLSRLEWWLAAELRLRTEPSPPSHVRCTAPDFEVELSTWPEAAIAVMSEEGISGTEVELGTIELANSIDRAIANKLVKHGTNRPAPTVRPCHLIVYPNRDFGQDLMQAIALVEARSPVNASSHYDAVWLSSEAQITRLP